MDTSKAAAYVDHFTHAGIGCRHGFKAAYCVGYKVEVAGGGERTQLYGIRAIGYLRDDSRYDGASTLARAIRVERADDGYRGLKGVVETHGNLICTNLGSRVRRLTLKGVVFGDGYKLCRAVNFAG